MNFDFDWILEGVYNTKNNLLAFIVEIERKLVEIKFEEIDCLICGENDTELLSVQDKIFKIVRCRKCGLAYQNPRPIEECIPTLYTDDKYFCNPEIGYDNYVKTFFDHQDLFEKIFRERLKLIQKFKQNGRVLEIGCAHGFHLDFLRRLGWETYGIRAFYIPI